MLGVTVPASCPGTFSWLFAQESGSATQAKLLHEKVRNSLNIFKYFMYTLVYTSLNFLVKMAGSLGQPVTGNSLLVKNVLPTRQTGKHKQLPFHLQKQQQEAPCQLQSHTESL